MGSEGATPSWEGPLPASMGGSPSGLSRVLQALSQMMTLPTMKEDALLSEKESQRRF